MLIVAFTRALVVRGYLHLDELLKKVNYSWIRLIVRSRNEESFIGPCVYRTLPSAAERKCRFGEAIARDADPRPKIPSRKVARLRDTDCRLVVY